MNTVIRKLEKNDFHELVVLARESFWNLYVPGCSEHLVVANMKEHKDTLYDISFVLKKDEKIIGAVLATKSSVVDDNSHYPTITFGPVMISPTYQRMGLGRKLMTHSIEQAKALGYKGILVLGFPHHYRPYGFLGAKAYGICMSDSVYYQGLLAFPLVKDALKNIQGYAMFSDVFEVSEKDVKLFDEKFEKKEKLVLPCQEEFAQACMLVDDCHYEL